MSFHELLHLLVYGLGGPMAELQSGKSGVQFELYALLVLKLFLPTHPPAHPLAHWRQPNVASATGADGGGGVATMRSPSQQGVAL